MPQEQVFHDRQLRDKIELLMDYSNPKVTGRVHIRDPDSFAVYLDMAFIGLVNTAHHFDKR